jgi:hypothetical protein
MLREINSEQLNLQSARKAVSLVTVFCDEKRGMAESAESDDWCTKCESDFGWRNSSPLRSEGSIRTASEFAERLVEGGKFQRLSGRGESGCGKFSATT